MITSYSCLNQEEEEEEEEKTAESSINSELGTRNSGFMMIEREECKKLNGWNCNTFLLHIFTFTIGIRNSARFLRFKKYNLR